jgi:hypothetical protein
MLVDPVVLPFAAAEALNRPEETVSISVALPTSLTTVMAADRLARNACMPAASTDVSDCHTVLSEPVCPIPTLTL